MLFSFGHRNLRESSTLCEWLCSDVVLQRLVGKRFYKAITECAGRDAESLDGFRRGDVFDDIGIRTASMNQLPAGCVHKCAVT